MLLQWKGRLAASKGGADGADEVAAAEPALLVWPACIAVPAAGQPWPMVQLELHSAAASSGGGSSSGVPPPELAGSSVLCRQSGWQLPVEIWGNTAAAAAAALAEAASAPIVSASGDGSESEGDTSSPISSLQVSSASSDGSISDGEAARRAATRTAAQAAAGGSGAELPASCLWVRPVGLRPGRCELEVQMLLGALCPLGSGAGATGAAKGVVLTAPAPLLVLRDAAAAREVQGLVQCSGSPGAVQAGLR